MSTRFYKEREHTAEALEVYHVGSSTTFFPIFVLPTKIKSFFVKDLIDQAYKVYKVRNHQTLTCLWLFPLMGSIRVWCMHLVHA